MTAVDPNDPVDPVGPVGPGVRDALDDFIASHRPELVAFRRHLHTHPELSFGERETTVLVAERLATADLQPRILDGGCGLICDIGVRPGRPIVALRADLDALAMDDEKEVAYRSRRPGVAHACGHDVHTTVVLGAGLALAQTIGVENPRLDGGVRLIFEPGEEVQPSGAISIVADGALDGVSAIYGLHCDPKLVVGDVGVRVGTLTAATDHVEVHLSGPGGHTARPQLTVDLVALAGRLAAELPARTREMAEGRGELLVVFGMLHAGDAANVIPSHAVLKGTARTHDRDLWSDVEKILHAALDELLRDSGARWELVHHRGTPPVVNDRIETARLAAVAGALLGADHVAEAPQSFGGDSFSWYLDHVPGTYARLGVHDPGRAEQLDLHSCVFDVHEGAIDVGVRVLAATALAALADHAGLGDVAD